MNYPYIATSERASLIQNEYHKINKGDSISTVLRLLNEPDEIQALYEPQIYKPNVTGKTYWYIIQRISNTGSVNEKNDILVRITFDLNENVVNVHHRGF